MIDTSLIRKKLGEQEIEDYVDVIDKLGERGIIPPAFSQSIRGMVA
ncbi:MAG TPA: hypothetical protein VFF47_09595 [Nitrospirota bacterium]|nr:hypothetical protein [Nitrospirota bacterium]